MPRPRKDGRLRMDTSLRIPVTSEQKAAIDEATADEPEGMASWARSILLQAAREKIARKELEKQRRKEWGIASPRRLRSKRLDLSFR